MTTTTPRRIRRSARRWAARLRRVPVISTLIPQARPASRRPTAPPTTVHAVDAYEAGNLGLAWARFADVPAADWRRWALEEYLRSGLAHDRDRVVADLRDLATDPAIRLSPASWDVAVGLAFAEGESDLARTLFARFDDAVSTRARAGRRVRESRDWMRDWVQRDPVSASAPAVPPGTVSFAVLAYGHPGRRRASANIGDHVQSLAMLGHVVRRSKLRFAGDERLAAALTELQGRVPERMRHDTTDADVSVITVDRDASAYAAVPPQTWTIAFGWYMHALFGTSRYGLPFHANLLPVFVSFHCSKRDLLNPEVVDYLRRHGPIGCRDWTTVDLLLSMDVPAFFSGCVTTTVSTVFPDLAERPAADAPRAYVDVPADQVPEGGVTYRHGDDRIRTTPFVDNLRRAAALLETYRTQHSGLVTSRLHAYLPARSLGIDAEFVPPKPSDPRFAGLTPMDDQRLSDIRTGITGLLEPVLDAILGGAAPDDVYALWRTVTADRVAQARARHDAPAATAARTRPLPAVIDRRTLSPLAATDAPARTALDREEVVVLVGRGGGTGTADQVGPLIASLAEHSRHSARVTLVGPGAGNVDVAAEPDLEVRRIETDGSVVDVFLTLPDLLPDVDRAVMLTTAAVVDRDLAPLAALDLEGHLFAAPTTLDRRRSSGFGVIETAAVRLGAKVDRSTELRRIAYQAHTFDFDAFDVDVLVADLAAMRGSAAVAAAPALVEAYGLRLREVLHVLAGPDRAVVPAEYAAQAR
ncbi:hypothetical protein FE697_000165 [Mumia zhuanghuii]|uniref:Uncharacterized protein n=2 Tax=Mumia TaxID=1546255 RepID=A0A5Q6S2E8_9ACTN|nr:MULTISPECIES: hypothetical protein [Mumia]KAA1418054.1 hypothetical protein FE697_021725 [Mumia zhuanghuii]KAA1424391.1 hypothetical protein FE697_000165 [Mumia zhuanghuii]